MKNKVPCIPITVQSKLSSWDKPYEVNETRKRTDADPCHEDQLMLWAMLTCW